MTRRLLKSPEPNLPNYFSIKQCDQNILGSETVQKQAGGTGIKLHDFPYDSRAVTPEEIEKVDLDIDGVEDEWERDANLSDNVRH